jgi:CysZ protein
VARAAAGAWHVPAGLAFLATNRNLWPLAILPVLLAAVLVGLGAVGGLFLAPIIESRFAPSPTQLSAGLGLVLTLSLWAGIVFAAMTVGLALTLLLSAPMLERLSRKVEAQVGGRGAGRVPSERWEIGPALRAGAIFLTASLLALALALVPLVGPFLSLALAAPLLCYQAMDPTLRRRGFGMEQERHWLWRWRGEAAGFGLAALLALLIPGVSALLPPALAIGAARLVLDLEGVEAEQAASTPDGPPAA